LSALRQGLERFAWEPAASRRQAEPAGCESCVKSSPRLAARDGMEQGTLRSSSTTPD